MRPVEGAELFRLEVRIPSPTQRDEVMASLWMDGEEPSLGFGAWHTHASVLAQPVWRGTERILDTVDGILHDRIVLFADDADSGPPDRPIDLRNPEDLAETLTSPWSSGRGTIFSWGGTADRKVVLDSVMI